MRQVPKEENGVKPARPEEPLRQYGMGPALLIFYTLGLVMLQLVLVSLNGRSSLQGC